jgi:predicted ribosomally synthesized peptide with nif11-like leader
VVTTLSLNFCEIQNFFQEVDTDDCLASKLESIEAPNQFFNLIEQLSQKYGYSFSANDVEQFFKHQYQIADAILDETELQAVAGRSSINACPMNTRFTVCVTVSGCWTSVC